MCPALIGVRRSSPLFEKRHVKSLPSEEILALVQSPQNGSVTLEMIPTSPPLGNLYLLATSLLFSGMILSISPIISRISEALTTSSRLHPLVVPTSMYSMNRTAMSLLENLSTISMISFSFEFLLTTVLIFTGPKPTDSAASIPAITAATVWPESVIAAKVASSMASRLTVTLSRPAAERAGAYLGSRTPLVVIAISASLIESMDTKSWRFLRNSGSPPVSLIFFTPKEMKIPAILSISSKVIMPSLGMNGKSFPNISFGMQYVHLKLHLSVTEILRSRIGLPKVSKIPGSLIVLAEVPR